MKKIFTLFLFIVISVSLNAQNYTWEEIQVPSKFPVLGFDKFSDGKMIAISNTIATSTDYGSSWQKDKNISIMGKDLIVDDFSFLFVDLKITDNDIALATINEDGMVFISTDKGESWQYTGFSMSYTAVKGNDIYLWKGKMNQGEGLYVSKDDGKTWDMVETHSDEIQSARQEAIFTNDAGDLFLILNEKVNNDSSNKVLYKLENGSDTFKSFILKNKSISYNNIVAAKDTLYTIDSKNVNEGGNYIYHSYFFKSNDYENELDTVYAFPAGYYISDMLYNEGVVLVTGQIMDDNSTNQRLLKYSADYGETWTDIDIPADENGYRLINTGDKFYISTFFDTYESTDLMNWEKLPYDNLSNHMVREVKVANDGNLIVTENFGFGPLNILYRDNNEWIKKPIRSYEGEEYTTIFHMDKFYNSYVMTGTLMNDGSKIFDKDGNEVSYPDSLSDFERYYDGNNNDIYILAQTNNMIKNLYRWDILNDEWKDVLHNDYNITSTLFNNVQGGGAIVYVKYPDKKYEFVLLDKDGNIKERHNFEFKSPMNYITRISYAKGKVYIVNQDETVIVSDDWGQTWEFITDDIVTENNGNRVYDLVVVKDKIYAGTLFGIYKTDINNIDWKLDSPEPSYTHDLYLDNNNVLYTSTSRAVYKTSGEVVSVGEEYIAAQDINIYPNPVKDIATIDLNKLPAGEKEIAVYDLSGSEIYAITSLDKEVKLDLSSLAQGTYIVKIIAGNNNYQSKINVVN